MAANCPFNINNQIEAQRYTRWCTKEVTPPHIFSWDMLDQLGVSAELEGYLHVLGLSQYARMNTVGSTILTQEFLTTLSIPDDYSYVEFRLMDNPRRLTLSELSRILGCHSPSRRLRAIPGTFNPRQTWVDLTGYDNWESGGLPSAFLRDHVLAILHRFLAYAISGNYEGNKVNKTELFLLDCAVKGIRVCAASFILQSLLTVLRISRCRPTLPMVVSAIADNFWLTPAECYNGDVLLYPVHIDFHELRRARIITRQATWYLANQRPAVINYVNAVLAAQNTNEDSEEDEDDDGMAANNEVNQPVGHTIAAEQFAAFHDDLRNIRQQQQQQWDGFQTWGTNTQQHYDNRFDAQDRRLANIDTRLEEQNRLLAQQMAEVRENNRRIADLADQWSSWAIFGTGASSSRPPPDDSRQ